MNPQRLCFIRSQKPTDDCRSCRGIFFCPCREESGRANPARSVATHVNVVGLRERAGAPRCPGPDGRGAMTITPRTKEVWPIFRRGGATGMLNARRRAATAVAGAFRPGCRKRGGSKPRCPVDGGQPRARRGGGPWARRQCGGPNLKNLFGRSGTIPGSPVQWPSERGVVVQSVRMLACHAGGRGFESRPLRHLSRKARESGLSAFRGSLPAAADERARVARPGCGEPSRSAVNCRATEIEPRIDAAKTPR